MSFVGLSRAKNRCLIGILCLLGATQLSAQTSDSIKVDSTSVATEVTGGEVEEEHGGWSYLGQRLFYQMKRRMNLTTEQEDEVEKEEGGKPVKLRIFGMEIERKGGG